ncbi:hypothetical protein KUTeg_006150 [Tegillarca granosa]|uniref:Uncharacterized protein n=1 Tax=Tegillarca granosa TaxID=220873 RepID=A0ABQ9FIY3_TEGGR|nr:hypothetical protein KUTeg_006150 [Tegillarca granosa]
MPCAMSINVTSRANRKGNNNSPQYKMAQNSHHQSVKVTRTLNISTCGSFKAGLFDFLKMKKLIPILWFLILRIYFSDTLLLRMQQIAGFCIVFSVLSYLILASSTCSQKKAIQTSPVKHCRSEEFGYHGYAESVMVCVVFSLVLAYTIVSTSPLLSYAARKTISNLRLTGSIMQKNKQVF